MQFERIRKSHKKEILIGGLITLGIVSAITLVTTKAKYKVTQDIPLVSGNINYKPYDFKIMAMYQSDDRTSYTEITTMPESGYIVNEEKTYCTTDNKTEVKVKIKTIDGNVAISNLNKSDKCYLYFDKKTSIDNASDLLAKVQSEAKTVAPDFSVIADTDEGVYAVSDGIYGGYSYYWRGAVTNNYVKFADFCWRIVRINGDGSIRLIYDGTTCHVNGTSTVESTVKTSIMYNEARNNSSYVGWTYMASNQRPIPSTGGTASNAKTQLENWYSSNITGTNASKVAAGKYCNDRDVGSGTWSATVSSFYYAAYTRLEANKKPTLSCPSEDIYPLNVGLITVDEVAYAGGVFVTSNKKYYLYNEQNYWTMSPSLGYGSSSWACVFFVHSAGSLNHSNVLDPYGLRPVINLRSDISFSNGDGTLNSPYVVS